MARIRVLDDGLINRIAAGEVIERPASAVKELVENAVDAGARTIRVELRGGGRQRIRVEDDGCGMGRDDALLALERHATSKIVSARDLDAIATLGFRGEALSSIAAVSRFTLRTAPDDGLGTEVEVHGGRIREVHEIAAPRGTTISVERLFFNVPARRKFLRSDGTELSHVLRWITRYALAYPSLGLNEPAHDGRVLLATTAAAGLRERVEQIHGRAFVERMLPFDGERDGVRVEGFAGRPVDALPRRDAQHFIVNGRAVQDRVLGHAVFAAYGNTMAKGRHPAMVLSITMPGDEVDVNVHPQKTEVRFRHSARVHDLVRDTIAGVFDQPGAVPRLTDLRGTELGARSETIRESIRSYQTRVGDATRDHTLAAGAAVEPAPARQPADEGSPYPGPAATADLPWRDPSADAPRALAQYRESYIVAADRHGLVLVDQHAAHERVLYEAYLAEAAENRVETQRLMFPVTVELAPADAAIVTEQLGEFRRLGFVVEPFGAAAVRLDGIPALARDLEPERFFRELVGEAGRARSAAADVGALRHSLVTTAACHAAIKINHGLTTEAMQGLLDRLARLDSPTTCPHGRPISFRLGLDEIERAFRRR